MGGLFKGLLKKANVRKPSQTVPEADTATADMERRRAEERRRQRLGRSQTVLGTSDTLGP